LSCPCIMYYMCVPYHKKYDELRISLMNKWEDDSVGTSTGISVILRLPDGTKVKAVIDETCTAKVSNLCIKNIYSNYCIIFYNTLGFI